MLKPYPEWLHALAWLSLTMCLLCAIWIATDEYRRRQKMWIMNIVWPVTALYFGPLAVWLYRRTQPQMVKGRKQKKNASTGKSAQGPPDRVQTSVAVYHCGAGCTLGDILGESLVPILGLTFAGEFGSKLVVDFLLAYVFGIAFQYFTIVPMRGLSVRDGLKAAVRADTISIALFEVGMFAWMALSYFVLFPSPHLTATDPVFWFMMQIAMIAGFVTSYPANRWLITKGWKEKMPAYRLPDQQKSRPPKAA